ncbi:hypothetical protein [Bosea caraganae]|nr:hypothetical protein [Bosea caraganae]
MKSGHGRLILRDGMDVPLDYCMAALKEGARRHGSLIGDLSKIDAGEFAYTIRYVPADDDEFTLLVTTFHDNYLTFVSDVVQSGYPHEEPERS